jgi:hypothetical protein
MSGESFKNRPKTRYPTDFGIGPIEYVCVCGTWISYERQIIYGLKPLES